MNNVTTKNIDVLRHIEELEDERDRRLKELARLREAFRQEVDSDVGEGDPELVERDRISSLLQMHERKLADIEQAIAEAQEGMYGICERCGQPIDPERLAILPETTLCVSCKQIVEKERRW